LSALSFGICTLGCRVNQYESDRIHSLLTSRGFVPAPFSGVCDVYILNTCTVTAESDRKCRQMIRRAHAQNEKAPIFVCGCYSQMFPEEMKKFPFVTFFSGTKDKDKIADRICEHFGIVPPPTDGETPILPQSERVRAYIKIEDGCENKCAYCIIPFARGPVVSRDPCSIVKEAELISQQRQEIVLTGIETASYGVDRKDTDLLDLFSRISAIDGIKRIRCGSLEPSLLKPAFTDRLAAFPKVMPFFHLSMQSGCDKTLARMRRRYNTGQILRNLSYLKDKIPSAAYAYDMIVGFPGESEEDFEQTLSFVRETRPSNIHIFTYSIRKGTEAATMPGQIPEEIKIERSHRLASLRDSIRREQVESFIESKTVFTLLAEQTRDGLTFGHTETFLPVAVRGAIAPNQTAAILLTDQENNTIYGSVQ